MKMTQTEICDGMPSLEIFYDGQLRVDYSGGTFGVVDIPRKKIHWRDALLMRGYRDLPEAPDETPVVEDNETPKATRRKKVNNE
jgi:hypothetical protein